MNTDAEYLTWWEKVKERFQKNPGRANLVAASGRAAWLESEAQTKKRLEAWLHHLPTCDKLKQRSSYPYTAKPNSCTCGLDQSMGVGS